MLAVSIAIKMIMNHWETIIGVTDVGGLASKKIKWSAG